MTLFSSAISIMLHTIRTIRHIPRPSNLHSQEPSANLSELFPSLFLAPASSFVLLLLPFCSSSLVEIQREE